METHKEYKHDLTRMQTIFKTQKQSKTSILSRGHPKPLDPSKYLISSKHANNTHDGARFASFRHRQSRPSVTTLATSPTDSLAMAPRYEGVSVCRGELRSMAEGRCGGRDRENGGRVDGVDGCDQGMNSVPRYLTPLRKVVTGDSTERQRLPPVTSAIKCQEVKKYITATGASYSDNLISITNNHLSQNIGDMISQLQEKNQNLKQKSLVYDSEFHELMTKYRNLKSKQAKMVSLQHAYDTLMKKFEASEETRKKQELEIFSIERQAKRMMIDRS